MMENEKMEQSLGQFQQLTEEFMTYTGSSQLTTSNSNQRKIATATNGQKPKLKMINEPSEKKSSQSFFYTGKKQRKHASFNCKILAVGDAIFRSNFQSGNLQTVQKIAPATYEVTLTKQLNSYRTSAWFYFVAQGLKGEIKFVIKGFTKSSSLYNQGMKICYKQAHEGKWRRGGTKIFYTDSYSQKQQDKTTYQLHFSFFFKSNYPNSVQFAYCFPYTYSNLLKFISLSQTKMSIESLGKSYEGRQIPLLTIGNNASNQVIIVSARAHPGQTVGSLMMQGFLKQLISDSQYSRFLRSTFLFKIVPMINPDGVFNGHYRFSSSGFDLNRKWKTCSHKLHPQVYLFKQKIRQINKEKQILMYIDFHGHSRQKNIFFYGCTPKQEFDEKGNKNTKPKQFPFLMSKLNSAFRYQYCSYAMQKQKEGTARITLWNQLKTDYIYTLEASMCGTDTANFLISDYQKSGAKVCQGIFLQFWPQVYQNQSKTRTKQQIKQIEIKVNEQINKNMAEFFQNPELAKVQYEGNSSDSQPQAGQIPQQQRKKQKSAMSIQKYYKASRIMKFSQKNFIQDDIRDLAKIKNNGQVKIQFSTNSRNKTNQSVRLTKQNGFQCKNSQQDSKNGHGKNQSSQLPLKNQNQFFMKSQVTTLQKQKFEQLKRASYVDNNVNNLRIISQPFSIKHQNSQQNSIKVQSQKNKKKVIGFEGAQYRRVRKLAQQHNRRHYSAQNSVTQKDDETLIRGLVGMNNLLQIDKSNSRQRAPSFFPNTTFYNKTRKNSVQMHFRRQIKAADYTSRRLYVNGLQHEVKCYGKQIF